MNGYEKPIFQATSSGGQYVAIHHVELLHNGKLAVTVTLNRQTFEFDTVADARLIEGMGAALLASAHRKAAA